MGSGISKSKHSVSDGGKKQAVRILNGHTGGINCFDVTSDSSTLLTGSDDRTGRIWDLVTYECKVVLEGHSGYISCCRIWDDKFALTGSFDKTIRKWNLYSGNCVLKLEQHNGMVNRMTLYGSHLFSTSYDRTIVGWDLFNGQPTRVFRGHKQSVLPIVYYQSGDHDPKGKTDIDRNKDSLITGSMDETAKMWSIQSGTLLRSFKGHKGAVLCLSVDFDKNILFTGSTDFTIKKWNISDAQLLKTFKGHEGSIICLEISHKLLYSASVDSTARCWVADFGDTTRKYTAHEHMISDMKYHNGFVITGSGDNTVRVFDAKSGALKRTFKGHKYVVNCVLPIHDTILSGSYDGTIRIWSIRELVMEKFADSEEISNSSIVSSAASMDVDHGRRRGKQRPPSGYSDTTITEENEIKKHSRVSPNTMKQSESKRKMHLSGKSIYDVQNAKIKHHHVVPVSVHTHSNNNNSIATNGFQQYDEAAKDLDELLKVEDKEVEETQVHKIADDYYRDITVVSAQAIKNTSPSFSNSTHSSTPGNERPQLKKKLSNGRLSTISPSTNSTNSTTSTSLSVSLPSGGQSPSDKRVKDMLLLLQKDSSKQTILSARKENSNAKNNKSNAIPPKANVLEEDYHKMVSMETASNSTGYHSDKSSPQSPKLTHPRSRGDRMGSKFSYNSFYGSKSQIPRKKTNSTARRPSGQSLW